MARKSYNKKGRSLKGSSKKVRSKKRPKPKFTRKELSEFLNLVRESRANDSEE